MVKKAELTKPAYLIASVCIADRVRYMNEYAAAAVPLLTKYGGEVLVASSQGNSVEGGGRDNWTVVLRFPNRAQLNAFYCGAEYQPLKRLRRTLTNAGDVTLVDGFDPNEPLG